MAGITAIVEIDIKKVIALSTLSQLGIIIIILGVGNPVLAFFHLISHAFFKAILFMCAGLIIHRIKDYQDIRKIGFNYLDSYNKRQKYLSVFNINFRNWFNSNVLMSTKLPNFIKTESFYNISENAWLILTGILFLIPISVLGG